MEFDDFDPMHSASSARNVEHELQNIAAPTVPPEADVNAVDTLRRKRKRRSQKVCQPCRLRKVKCTYETPCRSCIERGHPQLCIYDSDQSFQRVSMDPANEDSERWLPSKLEWHEMRDRLANVDHLLRDLRDNFHNLRADLFDNVKSVPKSGQEAGSAASAPDADVIQGMSTTNTLTGDTVYLGGSSVPAMVVALAQTSDKDSAVQDLLNKSILPIFGLDNESATYPFVDLWGLPHGSFQRVELLSKVLPASDSECMQVFKQYRDTAHVLYPGIIDISQFEGDLFEFLRHRSQSKLAVQPGSLANQTVYGKDLHWLGLLFAALASGFQCSDIPRKERQMKSQVYGMKGQIVRNSMLSL